MFWSTVLAIAIATGYPAMPAGWTGTPEPTTPPTAEEEFYRGAYVMCLAATRMDKVNCAKSTALALAGDAYNSDDRFGWDDGMWPLIQNAVEEARNAQ